MSLLAVQGGATGTGTVTLLAPVTNTNRTLTLPDATGTLMASGDAISGTTGTFSGLIAANGGGIQFPATQVASAGANTLDDYEEGTWTPTDASGAGLTLTTQYSKYTKIGNMVYVCAEITYPSTADASRVQIGGLPFTSLATMAYGGFVRYTNSGAALPTIVSQPNTTKIDAYKADGTSFTNSQISSDRFDVVAIYQV